MATGCLSPGTVWRDIEDIPADLGPTVLAIGQFDGVHRGHQRLVLDAQLHAARLGVPVGAVTVDQHPATLLSTASQPAILTASEHKFSLLAALGLDFVLALPMSVALLNTSARDFAVELLAGRLHAVSASVGSNFRYGHRAAGDVSTLTAIGRRLGFDVGGVDLLNIDGAPVSSTRIRELIARNQIRSATALLGRFHSVEAEVAGASRTRANARYRADRATPPPGRYCARIRHVDDRTGAPTRPAHVTVDAHVLEIVWDRDFPCSLSEGSTLRVEFVDECE
jgi:riboflavin kinase/FMN adenylyltransferase